MSMEGDVEQQVTQRVKVKEVRTVRAVFAFVPSTLRSLVQLELRGELDGEREALRDKEMSCLVRVQQAEDATRAAQKMVGQPTCVHV